MRIINNKRSSDHTAELFKSQEVLNVYLLNVFDATIFMYKVNSNTVPAAFHFINVILVSLLLTLNIFHILF